VNRSNLSLKLFNFGVFGCDILPMLRLIQLKLPMLLEQVGELLGPPPFNILRQV
jgi:hypothetical protein